MILEKIYDEFVKHTKLSDAMYRAVFSKISEVLERIRLIKWESITYTYKDELGESSVFDFVNTKETPAYVSELFKNVFENFYEIPNNVCVSLKLQYSGVPYEIKTDGLATTIPDEIKFIKQYKLYNLFLINEKVVDVFDEFDKSFSFINQFKTDSKQIFAPILKRFENASAASQIIEDGLSENDVTSTRLVVEQLISKRDQTLEKLKKLDYSKKRLVDQKNKLDMGTKSYDYLSAEKEKLQIEAETLTQSKKDYTAKLEEADGILKEVEVCISDMAALPDDHEQKKTELNFLSKKKVMFSRERGSIEASVKDIESLLKDMSNRLRDVVKQLTEIENYSTTDIDVLGKSIINIETAADDLYSILIGIDNEVRQQKLILDNIAVDYEKGNDKSVETDATIQNIENTAIVDHLAKPDQPSSVTTVAKYLRYYFAFYMTTVSDALLADNITKDAMVAQAISAKIVLCRMFNVYFNQIFSPVHFSDPRVESIIKIVRNP